jgi:hypothetical protein
MAGEKTHEQQLRILEKRQNTDNAEEDFNAEEELKQSQQEREARQRGANLHDEGAELTDKDDREIIRGKNQESEHHKRRQEG